MPAMPIAESRAPIVVGMSATSSAISTVNETPVSAYTANGFSVTTANRKAIVRPASSTLSAISFGVLRRSAPSTSAIMRSMNEAPGSWVTSTTIRSESSRVPPVTADRSPPASRTTGADSPVIADSSTEPMPSMMVPSAGISSPASTTTTSPRRSSGAGVSTRDPSASRTRATVVWRVARSALAWAFPRPSAIASARLPNRTVSQSQNATVPVNHRGSPSPRIASRMKIAVVITLPISTTNMTGFRTSVRGSSLRKESAAALSRSSRVNSDSACLVISSPGREGG